MLKKIVTAGLSLGLISTFALASSSKDKVYKVKDVSYQSTSYPALINQIKAFPIFNKPGLKIKNVMKVSNGLYSFKASFRGRTFTFFWDKDKNALFNTEMFIEKNGNIITTPKIIDQKLLKETIAFTFGSGKKGEIYLFTDPQCPFCRGFEKHFGKKLEDYKVHVIFFPLSFHPKATPLVEWIMEAKTPQERYKRTVEAMKNPDLTKAGKDLGFKHWNDPKYREELQRYNNVLSGKDSNYKPFFKSKKQLDEYRDYLAKVNKMVSEAGIQGVPTILNKNFQQIDRNSL